MSEEQALRNRYDQHSGTVKPKESEQVQAKTTTCIDFW